MPNAAGFAALLVTPRLAGLGPGPRVGVESESSLTANIQRLCAGSKLSPEKRDLLRALVLLWHDHLDAAHSIAQSIDHSDGAFVHGIMHRREPDYGNATYWFRRVGRHGAFELIANRAGECLSSTADTDLRRDLLRQAQWDPFGFINACERAAHLPESDPLPSRLREIQRLEFESLLDWFLASAAV